MLITELQLYNFRNIEHTSINFNNRINVFCGRNGQGKTSFLEAIYFLSCTKSFRTSNKKDLIRKDSQLSTVKAKVVKSNALESKLELNLSSVSNATKIILNDKQVKLTGGYLGQLLTVSFCPSDLEIIRSEPSARRRFLDKHLSDIYPAYLPTLIRLNKALKIKSSLLNENKTDSKLLDPWDHIIAESSEKIFSYRQKFLKELENLISNILPILASADGQVSFEFISNCHDPIKQRGLTKQEIFQQILNHRAREILTKRSLIGSHKDDFSIKLSDLSAREFASQGQARSLVLLLKLGVAELIEQKTAEQPIILLDDVDSELDAGRAGFIFDIFAEKSRQIFISSTATVRSFFPANADFFEVSKGEVKAK